MMRVAFAGASGTGKTTLARYVAETYGIPLNPVGSRSTAQKMGFSSPYDVDAAGKRREFQHQLQREKIEWEQAHDAFVTDRTVFDEMAYTSFHDIDAVDAGYFERACEHMKLYTHVFFCPVAVFCKLGDDPHRKHDMRYQRLFDAALEGYLIRFSTANLFWASSMYPDERKRYVADILGGPAIR